MKPSKRILVVDDEPRICQLLNIKLGLSGYEVITTLDGTEAIELARNGNPDIILLDIVMPGVTGLDVLNRVRTFSTVPIIIFTGRPEIVELAKRSRATDYIAKPFNPDMLVKKIESILGAD
jgi:DNA-binding response OmpR family regulator